jgi:SAM-dependent methyltransferase
LNLIYLFLRVSRHFLPEKITRTLLRSGIFIKPGLETREPRRAAIRYQADLAEQGITIQGKHILVFGYGGRFAIGVELLRLGAAHVTLTDLFAPPDDRRNDYLLPEFGEYLERVDGQVQPKTKYLTLLHGDIRAAAAGFKDRLLDGVVSTSVYEHLGDVDGITAALASTLKPGGFFIAYIDLRDHYFKLPFEMLCYEEKVWEKWLNPTSNLNRYRMRDYRRVFERHLPGFVMDVTESSPDQFARVKARIRPEFLSGDDKEDAVTQIRVIAGKG